MRKTTTTLLAGAAAAAAVAAASSASATGFPTLAGTYLGNSVLVNSSCFGQPAGTETEGSTVFNFGGFAKPASDYYTNTVVLPPGSNSFGGGAVMAETTQNAGIPASPNHTAIGTEVLSIVLQGGTKISYATETYTNVNTYIDKNTFLESQTTTGGCQSSVGYVRVGK